MKNSPILPEAITTAAIAILKPYAPGLTLEKLNQALSDEQPEEALLTRDEAAAKMRVSIQTLDRAIKCGELPSVKIRKRIFVRESDVRNAIAGSGIHAA